MKSDCQARDHLTRLIRCSWHCLFELLLQDSEGFAPRTSLESGTFKRMNGEESLSRQVRAPCTTPLSEAYMASGRCQQSGSGLRIGSTGPSCPMEQRRTSRAAGTEQPLRCNHGKLANVCGRIYRHPLISSCENLKPLRV